MTPIEILEESIPVPVNSPVTLNPDPDPLSATQESTTLEATPPQASIPVSTPEGILCDIGIATKTKCDLTLAQLSTEVLEVVKSRVMCTVVGSPTITSVCRRHLDLFTSRFSSEQKIKGCANIFGTHKKRVTKGINRVQQTDTQRAIELGLPLTSGMYQCLACRMNLRVKASQADQLPSVDIEQALSSPEHGPPEASSPIQSTPPHRRLSRLLRSINVTPPASKQVVTKRKRKLRESFEKAQTVLKKAFQEVEPSVIQKNTETLTDTTLTNSRCEDCDALVNEIASKFLSGFTTQERYQMLTCLPRSMTLQEVVVSVGCSRYRAQVARKLRKEHLAFSAPLKKKRIGISNETKVKIQQFFLNTENSRPLPGQRDTIIVRNEDGTTERVAKHLMMLTGKELYDAFKTQYPVEKVSVSAFMKRRPANCKWTGKRGHHISCTCIIHENFKQLLRGIGCQEKISDALQRFSCDIQNQQCMMGFCAECPNLGNLQELASDIDEDSVVEFNYWERVNKRYDIITIRESKSTFLERFEQAINVTKSHHFVTKMQQKFIKQAKEGLRDNPDHIYVTMDFSENYTSIIQDAIQGYRWSNIQSTVHPFHRTYFDINKNCNAWDCTVIISDYLIHNSDTVACFLSKYINDMCQKPGKVFYVSDGCGGQYKNFMNMINLLHHFQDFSFEAEWHFTATAHGKSECDALGAVVKRSAKLHSLRGQGLIRNANELFTFCENHLKSNTLKFIFVPSQDVLDFIQEKNLKGRYSQGKTIPGTRSFHSFIPLTSTTLRMRRFSLDSAFVDRTILPDRVEEEQVTQYRPGQYIVARLGNLYEVGCIVDCMDEEYQVNFMKRGRSNNSFVFLDQNLQDVSVEEILFEVDAPTTATGRTYTLSAADWHSFHILQQ